MTEILTTGGTFDKLLRNPSNQNDYEFPEVSNVVEALKRRRYDLRPHLVRSLMWIDSLDMQDEHFQAIVAACMASEQEQIVVIHGTDRMIKSAQTVKAGFEAAGMSYENRSVVFTGAMVPYSVNPRHASYNLFHALEVAEELPGVHIAMSGEVFEPENVQKNYDTLMFEAISTPEE